MTRGISRTACILVLVCVGLTAFNPCGPFVVAVERPTAEQIAEMKAAGVYEQRLESAIALGNNRLSLAMTQKALRKIRMGALVARGGAPGDVGWGPFVGPAFAFPYTKPPELRSLGTVRTLTVLVDFADQRAETKLPGMTPEVFFQNIYGSGTSTAQSYVPFESMNAYYRRASQDKVDVQGSVLGWYHFGNNRATYAPTTSDGYAHNQAIFDMVAEALGSFDPQHDFAQYDNDNDGDIDLVTILYAGPNTGWMSFWWAYRWEFQIPQASTKKFDGKRLKQFVFQFISPRAGNDFNPRTLIHEMGHAFGLPDYYDYEPGVPPGVDGGVGGLDMMDANLGNHNAFSRWLLDWIEPEIVGAGEPDMRVLIASGSALPGTSAIAVFPGLADSAAPGQELFMLENRQRLGNDGGASPLPNDGLLVWHVDATTTADDTDFLFNNSDAAHKLLRLVRANNPDDFADDQYADAGVFYRAGKDFTATSAPDSRDYAGQQTGVSVTNISAPGEEMSVMVGIVTPPGPAPPFAVAPAAPTVQESSTLDPQVAAVWGTDADQSLKLKDVEVLQRDVQATTSDELMKAWKNAFQRSGPSPKNSRERLVLRVLLTQLATKDGLAAVEILQSLPAEGLAAQLYPSVLQAWAYNDADAAAAWYGAPEQETLRTSATMLAGREFAKTIFRALAIQDIPRAVAGLELLTHIDELSGAVEGILAAAETKGVKLSDLDKDLATLQRNRETAQAFLQMRQAVDAALEKVTDPQEKRQLKQFLQSRVR